MPEVSGLSKSKSVCVMLVVIACFGVLWPKIFFPMIQVGLNWGNEGRFSFERTTNEQMLPPKVREAMKSNPMRESLTAQKIHGRPQYYPGALHDRGNPFGPMPPTQSSFMNIMMPIFTIVIIVFFLYIILKMSFNEEDSHKSQTLPGRSVPNASRPTSSAVHPELRHFDDVSLRSRLRTARMSQPYYRTLNHSNRDNAMRALIKDMQVFRGHLQEANVCMCKIKKCELAKKAAQKCFLQEQEKLTKTNPLQSDSVDQDKMSQETKDETEEQTTPQQENVEETEFENEPDKENSPPEQEVEQVEQADSMNTELKRRKGKRKSTLAKVVGETNENINDEKCLSETKVLDKCDKEILSHTKNE